MRCLSPRQGKRWNRWGFPLVNGPSTPPDPAAELADWTRLGPDDFKRCYLSVYPRGSARAWEALVALSGQGVILAACREAVAGGFLERLVEAVGNWEADAGRPPAEIAHILARAGGASGVMQAIVNHAQGFLSPASLLAVYEAYTACAIVSGSQGFRGTAFLVRPDMVLTAAHVVLDSEPDGAGRAWSRKLLDDLDFSFRPRDGARGADRVKVRATAKDPLVDFSMPWGKWPNILNCNLAPELNPTLDYAFVRLAQRIDHIKPVTVDPPAGVEVGRRCWAMGYPAGTAGVVDINEVVDISPGGGRWLHVANTVPGMSGGCCVNDEGKLAGIHEGTFSQIVSGVPRSFNRGIGTEAIRRHQRESGKRDPIRSRIFVPGLEFDDQMMVRELYRAGLRVAAAQVSAQWDGAVRAVLQGADPLQVATLPGFHPWFGREKFEGWVRRAAPRERLCVISGERGAGASFCKQILRALLDPSGRDYLEVSPTQVAAFSPRQAIQAAGVATLSSSRTSAADFRYNDANDLVAHLRGGFGATIPGSRTIVIDFGSEGGTDRLIGTNWQEFVVRLLAEDSVRLVLIGLTHDEQSILQGLLADHPATEELRVVSIRLGHITGDEFEVYAGTLADARGKPLKTSELRRRIQPILGHYPFVTPGNPALQTAFFALAAITIEAGL